MTTGYFDAWIIKQKLFWAIGPEHTGHFIQPQVAAHCDGPEHTRATCGGDMYVMYANALSVAGTSHSLWHTWATNCSVLAKAWK